MPDEPIAIEGAGSDATPVRTTETNPAVLMMPSRDRFIVRYVVTTLGAVLILLTFISGWLWLHGHTVPAILDRWWTTSAATLGALLVSTSTPSTKKDT